MKPQYLQTKIFLDSGNPAETKRAVELLGFLDGQTTNPTLVAKNPAVAALKQQSSSESGNPTSNALTEEVLWNEYKKVALQIYEILPNGAISVEVYADKDTTYEEMLAKAQELSTWFPGVYVKLPITLVGLKVARTLVGEGINVNMTLCFSQEQAAAVYVATMGAKKGQVFVSPFIGRLDDIGFHGMDLIRNIMLMYRTWDSHVEVLGASIRGLDHMYGCINAGVDIITAPLSVLEMWSANMNLDPGKYMAEISDKKAIAYQDLSQMDFVLYDIHHELTDKGIEKFSADWKSLLTV